MCRVEAAMSVLGEGQLGSLTIGVAVSGGCPSLAISCFGFARDGTTISRRTPVSRRFIIYLYPLP